MHSTFRILHHHHPGIGNILTRTRTKTKTGFWYHRSLSSSQPTPHRTPPGRSSSVFLGTTATLVGLLGLGWAIDKYLYAEALGRTLRLAYNAGLIILDYKLNFNPDSSPDELHERVSQRISKTCLQNGGLYIKLGQSIAIQAAILPAPYKKAFEAMFDAAIPLPFEDVLRVWNQEFPAQPIDSIFDHFDPVPVACGSIAQVHQATLKNSGQLVAVKVQRPDIPIQMELDLFAYRSLLYVYQKVFELPVYFIAHYVSDQIRKETDFVCEAKNSERTATLIENDPSLKDQIYVPKVHWPLTTGRILTTEYVENGCKLTDEGGLRGRRVAKKEAMDLAMRLFSQMVFSYGWLHCDLHPGNVLVFKRNDGKLNLALIDHGLYIALPDQFRCDYCELWRSLFVLDTESIERIARGWGIANSDLFASATLLRPFKVRKQPPQLGSDPQLSQGSSNSAYQSQSSETLFS
ncbi:atypical/ABC1/ABC1-B protein kinase [Puccinia graminis f. sp. tritici CRL 75-36-700-3]|uniref:Atypical/ABC1/ABC1-B protein kinase n=1 Tax=Puccinia graminis f. sp. tritici (strain CRL 75-36-700-3 / race SCCL) TaxID=418459 RepID=E3KNQ8_PUCGT|nr:atypical/ABC1/ABC1-B protein kinase [Puccinia graminis f. sp. tritici CRL 75-36-700-3]EFP85933.2 atypical/ABC1/ABC1-B protein kinase [Puccinia graminis f. sp. tritici CRL 75-36-700-3]